MFRSKSKKFDDANIQGTSVCLIGCGPAGMSFLYAMSQRKAKGLVVPHVTCFEHGNSAGGLWRGVPNDDKTRNKPANAILMYEDMWCNTPKELMEYYDYTFETHFGKQTPAYLPRQDILEYIISRNSVDGALDDVMFNHNITSVKYDENSKKFTIEAIDNSSGKTSTVQSDKCIWAAGLHGEPFKPPDVLELLKDFTGTVLHSAEAAENFEKDVKGKKILIIGDARSAEDLALRAIKLDADHVYVCARSGDGEASSTGAWPSEKVTVIYGPPYKVLKGTGFKCQAVYWSEKRQRYRKDDDEDPVKVLEIDTVVMATGYDASLNFLPESLQFDDEGEWTISKGWQMDNNALTVSIGNPSPSKTLSLGSTCYPDVYRGLLISNPDMMFIHEAEDTLAPIIELDVLAHLVLGYLTGQVSIPKEKDMHKANQKQLEAEMQVPWLRAEMDASYGAELDELPDDHWCNNPNDKRGIILDKMRVEFMVSRLARDATDSNYPVNFGKWNDLSEKGRKFVSVAYADIEARTTLTKHAYKTFRDNHHDDFESIHTGQKAVALPKSWMNLIAGENLPTKIETVSDKNGK